MKEAWRELRVGDRVRVVRMPSDWDAPGYFVPTCTRRLYRRLIGRRRSVRVYKIDESGVPWIACRFQKNDGSWEYHLLAMNDDSWIRVRSREMSGDA